MWLSNENTAVALKVHFSSYQLVYLLACDCYLIDDWIAISHSTIFRSWEFIWQCDFFIFHLGFTMILTHEELLNFLLQFLIAFLPFTNLDSITLKNVVARLSICFLWKFTFVLSKWTMRLHYAIIINAFFFKVRQILILRVELMSFKLLVQLLLRAWSWLVWFSWYLKLGILSRSPLLVHLTI